MIYFKLIFKKTFLGAGRCLWITSDVTTYWAPIQRSATSSRNASSPFVPTTGQNVGMTKSKVADSLATSRDHNEVLLSQEFIIFYESVQLCNVKCIEICPSPFSSTRSLLLFYSTRLDRYTQIYRSSCFNLKKSPIQTWKHK